MPRQARQKRQGKPNPTVTVDRNVTEADLGTARPSQPGQPSKVTCTTLQPFSTTLQSLAVGCLKGSLKSHSKKFDGEASGAKQASSQKYFLSINDSPTDCANGLPLSSPTSAQPSSAGSSFQTALGSKDQKALSTPRSLRKPRKKVTGSHAKKRLPGHIPRPRNAFILFRSHAVRMGLVPQDMERDHRNISRIVSHMWNSLSESDRTTWQREAQKEKEQHAQLYPDYKYRPAAPKQTKAKRDLPQPEEVEEKCETVADMILKMYGEQGLVRDVNGQTLSRSERFRRDRHLAHEEKLAGKRTQGTVRSAARHASIKLLQARTDKKNPVVGGSGGVLQEKGIVKRIKPNLPVAEPMSEVAEGHRRSLAGDLATSIHCHRSETAVPIASNVPENQVWYPTSYGRRGSSVPPLEDSLLHGSLRVDGVFSVDACPAELSTDFSLLPGFGCPPTVTPADEVNKTHKVASGRWSSKPTSYISSDCDARPAGAIEDKADDLAMEKCALVKGVGGRGSRKQAPTPFNFASHWSATKRNPAVDHVEVSPMSQINQGEWVDLHGSAQLESPGFQRRQTAEGITPRVTTFEGMSDNALCASQHGELTLLSPIKSAFFGTRRRSTAGTSSSRVNNNSCLSSSGGKQFSPRLCSAAQPPYFGALYPPPTPFGQFPHLSSHGAAEQPSAGVQDLSSTSNLGFNDAVCPAQNDFQQSEAPVEPMQSIFSSSALPSIGAVVSNDEEVFQFSSDFLLDVQTGQPSCAMGSSSESSAPPPSHPPSTATDSVASPLASPDVPNLQVGPTAYSTASTLSTAINHKALNALTATELATSTSKHAHIDEVSPTTGAGHLCEMSPLPKADEGFFWPEQDGFSRGVGQRMLQHWIQNYHRSNLCNAEVTCPDNHSDVDITLDSVLAGSAYGQGIFSDMLQGGPQLSGGHNVQDCAQALWMQDSVGDIPPQYHGAEDAVRVDEAAGVESTPAHAHFASGPSAFQDRTMMQQARGLDTTFSSSAPAAGTLLSPDDAVCAS